MSKHNGKCILWQGFSCRLRKSFHEGSKNGIVKGIVGTLVAGAIAKLLTSIIREKIK